MVWVILLVGLGVLGLAAFAANGRLGEMPAPVDARHVPAFEIPDDLSVETLGSVEFHHQRNGYDTAEVDALIEALAAGDAELEPLVPPTFATAARGYRIDEVDAVFDRLAVMRNNGGVLRQEEMRQADGSDEATHG